VKQQLIDIASHSNVKDAVMKAPEAYNILLSSGMNEKVAMNTVDPTLRAAKAGRTDVKTTADALSNTMNSTGITDANRVLDVLFATLNKGKAEFVDIANYLPKIIPGADAVGASFEQTAGAFAFLTANGLKAEAASTGLQNVFKSFRDVDTKKHFADMGVQLFDLHGKFRGMSPIVENLKTKLAGMSDEQRAAKLSSLGLDVEASTALGIMVKNYETLDPMIKSVTNSQGEFNKAEEYGKTKMDGWNRLVNEATVKWLALGDIALNGFSTAISWIIDNNGTIINFFKDLAVVVGTGTVAWGLFTAIGILSTTTVTAFSVGLGIANILTGAYASTVLFLTAAQEALNAAWLANPIGIIVAAVIALGGALYLAYEHSEKFRAVLSGIWEVAKVVADVFIGLGKTIMGALTLDPTMIADGAKQSAKAISSIMDGGLSRTFNKGYDSSMAESKAAAAKEKADPARAKKEEPNHYAKQDGQPKLINGGKPEDKKKGGEGSGITGGEHVRNITINKIVFAEKFNSTNAQLSSMNPAELEKWFNEFLQRTILNMVRS